jgi:hypothetical protein
MVKKQYNAAGITSTVMDNIVRVRLCFIVSCNAHELIDVLLG